MSVSHIEYKKGLLAKPTSRSADSTAKHHRSAAPIAARKTGVNTVYLVYIATQSRHKINDKEIHACSRSLRLADVVCLNGGKMRKTGLILLLGLTCTGQFALADQAPEYTVIGAEQAGNAEGTIPPWTGGITTPPPGYKPGDWHPDPFKDDPVQLTINNNNAAQFKDKLSAGHRALMAKYPDTYHLNIYPTRRSASYTKALIDHTIQYSGKARVVDNGAGIEGIVQGVPFPHPENGEQAMWNARAGYKAGGYRGYFTTAITANDGSYELGVSLHEIKYPYSDPKTTVENLHNMETRGLMYTLRPAKEAGTMYLYHFFLNTSHEERRNWSYNPGKRRVKRSTMIPHDLPMGGSDGIHVWDQGDMFLGPITDFDWTLIGKQEMYIPYNAYRLHSGDTEVDSIIQPRHLNQELARYELHRVWVVEANRREGSTHHYQRRRYFLDEDSWRIVAAEHYNGTGEVERFSEAHNINYYEVPVVFTTLDVFYKLDTERYYLRHVDNQYTPFDFSFDQTDSHFMPGRLKMKAKR